MISFGFSTGRCTLPSCTAYRHHGRVLPSARAAPERVLDEAPARAAAKSPFRVLEKLARVEPRVQQPAEQVTLAHGDRTPVLAEVDAAGPHSLVALAAPNQVVTHADHPSGQRAVVTVPEGADGRSLRG